MEPNFILSSDSELGRAWGALVSALSQSTSVFHVTDHGMWTMGCGIRDTGGSLRLAQSETLGSVLVSWGGGWRGEGESRQGQEGQRVGRGT